MSFTFDIQPVKDVIDRFLNGTKLLYLLGQMEKEDGKDVFTLSYTVETVEINGSSPTALCRGFQEFMKVTGSGINSWSGNRFQFPDVIGLPDIRVASPVKHHYYFNVVTYGYTMPYWNWTRWE